MNYSPLVSSSPNENPGAARAARRGGKPLIFSLTGVCFLFGGLLAAQLRAVEQVRFNRDEQAKGQLAAQAQIERANKQFAGEVTQNQALQKRLHDLTVSLNAGTLGSKKQVDLLNETIKQLQVAAGLTPIAGPGVVVTLNDNPNASQAGAGAGPFLPGIVHDFDLLQVVNELRSAKADAIAINKRRITGYTPIRCVGPVVYINWEAVAPPFNIEAVGDPQTLKSALTYPGGIIENLKNNTLSVSVRPAGKLKLPATEGVPHLLVASRS